MTESPEPQTAPRESAEFWREDNVKNSFSGLGTSRDRHARTRPGAGRRLEEQEIIDLYLYDRFGRQIVDRLPEDCTRRGWKIEVDDAEDGTDPFAEDLKRLGATWKFRRAHTYARLRGGGGIVMILDDDGALDEPITGRVRRVKALHAFSRPELVPATYYTDIESEDFGKPKTYFFHPYSNRGGGITGFGSRVHAERVLRFEGLPIPEDRALGDYEGWGQPVLEAVWGALADIDTAAQAIASAMHEFQFGILKLKNIASLLTGPDGDRNNKGLRQRLDAIAESKSFINAIALDVEEDYELRETKFSGLIDAYSVAQQNLAASARYPLTLFFGQSPKGFSSNDETSLQNYYDWVRSEQAQQYEPNLVRLVELLAESVEGPTDGVVPENWRVNFHDLDTPDEEQEATIRKTYAEADSMNIDRGVYGPDEARTRYAVAGFSGDLTLQDDASEDETFAEMAARIAQLREQEGLDPEDITAGEPTQAPEEESVDREFNGAQISSMAEVVRGVAAGELPEGGAIEILKLGFGLSDARARAFFKDKSIKKEPEMQGPPGPPGNFDRLDEYNGPADPDLPQSVQNMTEAKREEFVAVFNEIWREEVEADPDTREERAFREAFSAVQDD